MNKYTGVGSRSTPKDILETMRDLAFCLSQEGWCLRSGGANGADTAFEIGASNSFSEVSPEIYLPWAGFNNHEPSNVNIVACVLKNYDVALEIASKIHPAWGKLSQGAKRLHARNCYQVLGVDLNSPSKFLICWAEKDNRGIPKGGTRTAWVLASEYGIPCINLIDTENISRVKKKLFSNI